MSRHDAHLKILDAVLQDEKLIGRLNLWCLLSGDRPADVVRDAIDLHLDELERPPEPEASEEEVVEINLDALVRQAEVTEVVRL